MPTFHLLFSDQHRDRRRAVEFDADTAAKAFSLIEDRSVPCDVMLWRGNELLAEIHRDREGVWQLAENKLSRDWEDDDGL